ncbi:hypothetical protein CPB85DRAFT_1480202, partial [Mucidula mucida]
IIQTVHWLIVLAECIAILVSAFLNATHSEFAASHLGFNNPGHPFSSHVAHPTSTFVLASLVTILGCIGRILCFRQLGPMFTFELARKKDQRLVHTPLSATHLTRAFSSRCEDSWFA